jgi:hypothetical protein
MNDKWQHFTIWYSLTLTIALFRGPEVAFWIMLSLGVGKEIWDAFKKDGRFDPFDLVADCLGIFFALGVHKLL